MTKYRVKVEKHVEEYWEEGRTFCDFCHQDVAKVNEGSATEIELDAKIGNHYGTDGDARDGYRLDVCEGCFTMKVMPAIEALGTDWHKYDPEDAYPSAPYGKYYKDDYQRMDGRFSADVEESTLNTPESEEKK